ncbi:MAG TPA: membrane protein insertase YidC [Burkholderiales bacterium]|nr:membrane protein insertase YidC [Burkholderiales bacterium]
MDTQRIILLIVFSLSIFLLWDAWQREKQPVKPAETAPAAPPTPVPSPSLTAPPAPQPAPAPLAAGPAISVRTDYVQARIALEGGNLVRLELLNHRGAEDQNFVLFQVTPEHTYVAQSGLIGENLPSHKTQFRAEAEEYRLQEGAERLTVTLRAEVAPGVEVKKLYTFRRGSYLIDVAFEITNRGQTPLAPHAYFQLLRDGQSQGGSMLMPTSYVGPAVYTEQSKFQKVTFSEIDKGAESYPKRTNDGWIAMLQHYFLAAWLPQANTPREFYTRRLEGGLYAAGIILPVAAIGPGESQTVSMPLYAGPQEQERLDDLAPGLELTVDYGWLTVIAAPLFWVLAWIQKWVHNWGVAIIILTVLIKAAFYWLSATSYRSMAKMRVVTPKLQRIKEQYGDDRQRLHQAMMDLYKTEKINPLGGCLPILVQIPVFIALYWVLLASVELRHAPFVLWIDDLSVPDPYFVLPILMGATMIIQTWLNPTPPDPIQAKMMKIMPVVFSVFFFFFPAGLVLYWLVNNILSIAQQWYITRSMEQEQARARR